jgi:hypothetical protein
VSGQTFQNAHYLNQEVSDEEQVHDPKIAHLLVEMVGIVKSMT